MNDTPKRKNTTSREARKRYDDAHFVKKHFPCREICLQNLKINV